jgi:monofunctional glycosyltransferase
VKYKAAMKNDPLSGKNTFRTKQTKPIETKKKSRDLKQKIKSWLIKFTLYFLAISIGLVVLYKFVPVPITSTMISRKLEAIAEGNDSEIYYDWTSYKNMSQEAPLAVVAAEDQLYPEHFGFDFEAMANAFDRNRKGKKLRGASTLSQQVAKNVFLWQSRSYVRKILEVYFTFLIEVIWGKERILEVYLNVAEMGDMTFGIEEASKRYYGTSAQNINRQQAARIAAVLPSPRKWSAANPGPYINRRTAQIVRQMRALGGVAYIKDLRSF